jgi:hypothetical protein
VTHALAIAGLSLACVGWFLLQRATGRLDECAVEPGPGEGACGSCGTPCAAAEAKGSEG